MIKKLLVFLFQKRINICVEDYQQDPHSYLSKRYKARMQTKLDVKKAFKQDLFVPDLYWTFQYFIEVIDNGLQLAWYLILLVLCPFYNLYKMLMFPGRLYLSRVVRAEILKRINNG